MQVTVYHNPRCSKSRATLELLQKKKIKLKVIEYLEDPPSPQELNGILARLGMEPREFMRKNEAPYRALGLNDEVLDRDFLIAAICAHPILMQRPVVLANEKAAIGRPPEQVLAIL
ncbi:MAG: arsenate reductase (glutaredoxin) [Gammaproteobacteria bacterium]|nr:arsenate reductase (glutaredoxin) [Gammaproteobacteria bacterium]MDH3412678.1 arsenate reductase (glutaredoxin) [Gammaproteobacteria bacterium]